jgi:hypothetical protein
MTGETHRTTLHSEALAQDSVRALLRRLVTDTTELISNEFALARSECTAAAVAARHALAVAGVAAAMLLGGILAVIAGTIMLLMRWMPPWLAAMGIGIVLAAAGLLLLRRMQRGADLDDLRLIRTRQSIQDDIGVITRRGK